MRCAPASPPPSLRAPATQSSSSTTRIRRAAARTASLLALALSAAPPARAATYTVLHNFIGTDGQSPSGDLIRDATGRLYGTTALGGIDCANRPECGVIYKLSPPAAGASSWTYTVLHKFSGGAGGNFPQGGLVADPNGVLYGATYAGGSGNGIIFKLSPPQAGHSAWSYNVIHNFGLPINGSSPNVKLLLDANGALYGTAAGGGSNKAGVIFKLTPPAAGQTSWSYTVLHNFAPNPDKGAIYNEPSALIADTNGTLYGTTGRESSTYLGTIFAFTPPQSGQTAWTYKTIHTFGLAENGEYPMGSLLLGQNGALFGVTLNGGAGSCYDGCGVVYELAPPAAGSTAWTYTKVRTLRSFAQGYDLENTPSQDAGGTLYITAGLGGSTSCGGSSGCGVIFKLTQPTDSSGELTMSQLHVMGNVVNGETLLSGPLIDSNGTLYGTAVAGGKAGDGVIYQLQN